MTDEVPSQGALGIMCPACHCRDWRVRKTEPINGQIRRRKICRNCGHKMRTFELSAADIARLQHPPDEP